MDIIQQRLWGDKICCNCGQSLPVTEFYKSNVNRDGLRSYCRACSARKVQEWKKKNPDRSKAIAKRTNIKRRDKTRAYHKSHRDKINASTRRIQRLRPEKYAEYERIRKHRQRGNGGSYTNAEWNALCARYDNRCLCCGVKTKLTVDHVIPVIHGGSSSIDNIQPLCALCNSKKGTQTIDYRTSID